MQTNISHNHIFCEPLQFWHRLEVQVYNSKSIEAFVTKLITSTIQSEICEQNKFLDKLHAKRVNL